MRDKEAVVEFALTRVSKPIGATLGFACIYTILATLSASTAFVQVNTAAVWIPSGFAVGLIIVRGLQLWPAIMLGSFVFNFAINLASHSASSFLTLLAVALCIAVGNTCEAVLGGYLARRFASGHTFMFHLQGAAAFALLVAPVPPLISALVGVSASGLAGFHAAGTITDVALTWYVGNYVGVMVFTGLTIFALQGSIRWPTQARLLEAVVLAICLCFAGQAICGFFLTGRISDWLVSYSVIPLLLWACLRFEVIGGLLAVAFITAIAVVGTLRGYNTFLSKSPWLALVYLQVFLGMLSLITLAISSSLAELKAIRATLEDRVKARTKQVERLMREREVFTVLVAHDLQSPIFGIRNALRLSSSAIANGTLSTDDLSAALTIMEQTCSTLAERVASLLLSSKDSVTQDVGPLRKSISQVLGNIASAHGVKMGGSGSRIVYHGDKTLMVYPPDEIEHIVDALIDNALKHSASDDAIDIAAFGHGGWIEIQVTDCGPGLTFAARETLFRPAGESRHDGERPGVGLGLYLASEKAGELGGRLTYAPAVPRGSTFRLVVPA